jgi:hypothetical protein
MNHTRCEANTSKNTYLYTVDQVFYRCQIHEVGFYIAPSTTHRAGFHFGVF